MQRAASTIFNDTVYLPNYVNHYTLTAATARNITIPTDCEFAILSAPVDFLTNTNGTAVVPASDVTDGTGSFLNIGYCRVVPGDVVSVISASTSYITLACYTRPSK